jgi:phenylalanyl-tRNA synthetase alpha chain
MRLPWQAGLTIHGVLLILVKKRIKEVCMASPAEDMVKKIVGNLHPLEVKVIRQFKENAELTIADVEARLKFKAGNGNQALSWLASKGVVTEKRREKSLSYQLTDAGRKWKAEGGPEEKLYTAADAAIWETGDGIATGLTLPQLAAKANIDQKDAGSSFGALTKVGILGMNSLKNIVLQDKAADKARIYFAPLHSILDKAAASVDGIIASADLDDAEKARIEKISKKRGAGDSPFRVVERETVVFGWTDLKNKLTVALEKAGLTGDETGALTPEMLADGSWRDKTFRRYNVSVPPARLVPGRTSPYASFLEGVKDKLVSLGFEEYDGSLVESEFWNCDALFMPQFHAARDIHDIYTIKEPTHARSIEEPWLDRVAAAHETGGDTGSRGWQYNFDRDFTRRLILRSQGTALSARQLPKAKIPGKYFGIVRVFRYDKVDATHLSDFYQTEGIVLGDDVNLKTLLCMLEMFAVEVAGAKEVKYVPGYFPFTEPSVEVHIKHPVLGWFELGGSGIFRPEVTASLGVNVPVAAWGIGIDRMALMALGLKDLRELFSYNLEDVRLRRAKL